MNTATHPASRAATRSETSTSTTTRLPLPVKLAYTAFLAVLIPVYWMNYGPTNFLYFCDVALLLTLAGVWLESALLVSMPTVGILLPQALWVIDFAGNLAGIHVTGMTDYMFNPHRPLFLRSLSLFHGWLPFLLVFLVARLGYDRRALKIWTLLAWALCLLCYFLMPPAGAHLADPRLPVNINYVWGFSDDAPQSWMPHGVYLVVWMLALPSIAYLPVHWLLNRWKGAEVVKA
jgi:hypothetical protein